MKRIFQYLFTIFLFVFSPSFLSEEKLSLLLAGNYTEHSVSLSNNQNYILTVTPLDATDSISVSESKIIAARDARFLTSIQYYDGLGRPTQTIQR